VEPRHGQHAHAGQRRERSEAVRTADPRADPFEQDILKRLGGPESQLGSDGQGLKNLLHERGTITRPRRSALRNERERIWFSGVGLVGERTMSTITKFLHVALLGAALFLASATASAAGIVIDAGALEPAARATLEAQIASSRAANPKAFEAVKNVKGHRPEHYRNNRNPYPTAARELRGLGRGAHADARGARLQAPPRGDLTNQEWDALATGMFEAVGMLRDARARPVLLAAFEANGLRPAVRSATARALGRLGGDAELALLVKYAKAGDPFELSAIDGLGQLRRIESAQHLATRLASSKDAAVANAAARSLGILGSSWAWRARTQGRKTGLAVRKGVRRGVGKAMAKRSGTTQTTIADSILMVEHPDSVALLGAARPAAGSAAQAIGKLIARVENGEPPLAPHNQRRTRRTPPGRFVQPPFNQ
jgi:hypothetical protein